MNDELVFSVNGATAKQATMISLADAGLTERSHLQEWVLAHPQILGSDVLIVTFEFDRWKSYSGQLERDRLDILGLDSSGRLVVTELKRDRASDTVEMQAIKYAAMASRFTPSVLAAQHARFLSSRGEEVTDEEALDRLTNHADLEVEALRQPRIILVARDFAPTSTATAVWLTEMGLDITLKKFVAYKTEKEILITVSRLYPVQDVEEFTVAPYKNAVRAPVPDYPEKEWTFGDFVVLREFANPTTVAALDLCSAQPDQYVALRDVEEVAGRTRYEARGDLAALTVFVKRRLSRSNWPLEATWAAGGEQQVYYRINSRYAEYWKAIQTDYQEESPTSASEEIAALSGTLTSN